MSLDIAIRPESPADHERVGEIQRLAFGERLQADLVAALRARAMPQLSLVASVEDELVGHVFFSPVSFDAIPDAPTAMQLSPVGVAPRFQGQGVGSALIRSGLSECAARGWPVVFLVGNPAYYGRFGFRMARPLGLTHPGAHGAFLQVVALRPNALAGLHGDVHFHEVFAELEAD